MGFYPNGHPSIRAINAYLPSPEIEFILKPVGEAKISGYFGRVRLGKAAGLDTIYSNILHLSEKVIIGPTSSMINQLMSSKFPDSLKHVLCFFKEKDPLDVQITDRLVSYLYNPISSNVLQKNILLYILKIRLSHIHQLSDEVSAVS